MFSDFCVVFCCICFIAVIIYAIYWTFSGGLKDYEKQQQEMMANAMVQNAILKVKSGEEVTPDDFASPEYRKQKEREEKKKIIEGAVVGGIIGGDAGAVIGASLAKDKIEKDKNK